MQQWRPDLREAFYASTNYLLRHTASFAIGVAIKHVDYAAAFEKFPLTTKDSTYGLAFRSAMVAVCKNIGENHKGEEVEFILEKGDPNQGGAKTIFDGTASDRRKLAEADRLFPVTKMSIEEKEKFGALQVADMHAYSVYRHLRSRLGGKYGATNEYHGDINILLSDMLHQPFRLTLSDIRNLRRASIENYMHKKRFGMSRIRHTDPAARGGR